MKTVIEMAREANIKQAIETPHLLMVSELERFAELVRADEREQGQKWFDAVTAQHKQAILAEREACAKVCDGWDFVPGGHEFTSQQLVKNLTDTIATQIRARGKHDV